MAQYILELDATNNIDANSLTHYYSPSDKLHLLRSHDTRRRHQLKFKTLQTLGPPLPGEIHQSCLMGTYGFFTDSSTVPAEDRTEMHLWRIENQFDTYGDGGGSEIPEPVVFNLDFKSDDYTFNEACDLLVVFRVVGRWVGVSY